MFAWGYISGSEHHRTRRHLRDLRIATNPGNYRYTKTCAIYALEIDSCRFFQLLVSDRCEQIWYKAVYFSSEAYTRKDL